MKKFIFLSFALAVGIYSSVLVWESRDIEKYRVVVKGNRFTNSVNVTNFWVDVNALMIGERPGLYHIDVYSGSNLIVTNIPLYWEWEAAQRPSPPQGLRIE